MKKLWIGVAMVFGMFGAWGLLTNSQIRLAEERISLEIAGLREQITVLTEKLSIKDPAITEQKDIPYVQEGTLKYPIGPDGMKIDSDLYFHEIQFDSTIGHQIGRLGAMRYILDPSGQKISVGFHEFFMKSFQLWGRLGATEKPVIL